MNLGKKEATSEKPVVNAPDKKEDILQEAIEKVSAVSKTSNVKVITNLLNVRSSASDVNGDNIIGQVRSGDILEKDEAKSNAAWTKINKPMDGYVMAKFVAAEK